MAHTEDPNPVFSTNKDELSMVIIIKIIITMNQWFTFDLANSNVAIDYTCFQLFSSMIFNCRKTENYTSSYFFFQFYLLLVRSEMSN